MKLHDDITATAVAENGRSHFPVVIFQNIFGKSFIKEAHFKSNSRNLCPVLVNFVILVLLTPKRASVQFAVFELSSMQELKVNA